LNEDARRRLPSVDQLLQRDDVRAMVAAHGRPPVLRELRGLLERRRSENRPGSDEELAGELGRELQSAASPSLQPMINATGVVIHTNLGRAPLPAAAVAAVARVAQGYSNLEYDVAKGERGDREVHLEARLRALLPAEATLVVNNNAAAVLLAVNTFAEGREVLVSRGELVEIGGSFRIPDVLAKGGARLVEVGTTNRTRLADFERAFTPATGMILKVHPSNFQILGFTEEAELPQLIALARARGVPLVEDLGSGLLEPLEALPAEPRLSERLRLGVDVVTASGDKLLGGPQAGIVAGRAELVRKMRKNALYRALRVDKLTLAALDAVLLEHASGRAQERLPALRMLSAMPAELRARAETFARTLRDALPGVDVALIAGASAVGGGAAPTLELETTLLAVRHPERSPDALAERLRRAPPHVVARVADGRLLLDLRTVFPDQEAALREALLAALASAR
jgi:L-seryl-tRNA(Ser) seleniumtransferase